MRMRLSGEKKRRTPIQVSPRIETKAKTKAEKKHVGIGSHNMTSVMPQIHSSCGMGTFSQKKVDEEFLKYLNS